MHENDDDPHPDIVGKKMKKKKDNVCMRWEEEKAAMKIITASQL